MICGRGTDSAKGEVGGTKCRIRAIAANPRRLDRRYDGFRQHAQDVRRGCGGDGGAAFSAAEHPATFAGFSGRFGRRGRTAGSARDNAAPAYLDVIKARAVLSDADRAVWQSLQSGESQFNGPGQQYENDITVADQDLQQVAALEAPGSEGSQLLQTVTGQLVTYQGLVEQADAANRADAALGGPTSSHYLGLAYLGYAGQSLNGVNGQGGVLPNMSSLSALNQQALHGQLTSWWADPALFVAFVAVGIVVLAFMVIFQLFLGRRFRRTISPPLLLAAALVCGLLAWMGAIILPADAAFVSARTTSLPRVVQIWQNQTQAVDAQTSTLQAGGNAADSVGVVSLTAAQPDSARFEGDLVSAQNTGGLLIGIPLITVVIAGLVFVAVKPRLDEYRGVDT
jgi:hypothetical protein